MSIAYTVATLLAAAANIYGASVDLTRQGWVLDNMGRLGVAPKQLPMLGALKAAGGIGLVVGLVVPVLGVAAGAGLVLYFVGAIVTVLRAGWWAHLPYPTAYLLVSAAALVLRLATW